MKKLISIALVSSLFAVEFQPLGFKAIGMGGAGVANASGSNAAYYNPALLAKQNYTVETNLEVGIGLREINLINPLDKLVNTYDLSGTIDEIKKHAPISHSNKQSTIDNIKGAQKEIYRLSLGNGLEVEPTTSFSFQIGSYALGVYGIGEMAANVHVDRERLYLIFKDKKKGGYYYYYPDKDTYGATDKETYENKSLEYALDNNLTYVNVSGVGIAEVPLSYARSFDIKGATVSFGTNLKYINGITYKNKLALEDTDSNTLEKSLNDNQTTTSTYGIDLGVLISSDRVRFGIVGKYLNSPKLKFYDGESYKILPMVRAGMAIDATDWITFAIDYDLTANETLLTDYKSQYVGGGVDIHPSSWFSFRFGASGNMLETEEGPILTTGIGLGLKWFQLDIAAQASTKNGTYKGNSIPRYTKINLALISRWGDGNKK